MLDELANVKLFTERLEVFGKEVVIAKAMRDFYIQKSFEAGNRQKDIGHSCGLSESTIKHIIAKLRKNRS